MQQIIANHFQIIPLGYQGEHLARQVVFDVREWETLYGPGVVELLYQRPGDTQSYPVALSHDGSYAMWEITATDTDRSGSYGACELRYRVGEVLVKSKIWKTYVNKAMAQDSGKVPPEPEQGWVDQVLEAGALLETAAERAEAAALNPPKLSEEDTWMVWDPETGEYQDTGVSGKGRDGLGIPATTAEDAGKVPVVQGDGTYALEQISASASSEHLPLVAEVKLTEEVSIIEIDTDINGNPFGLREMVVDMTCYGGTGNGDGTANRDSLIFYLNKTNTAIGRLNIGTSIGAAGLYLETSFYLKKLEWGHFTVWRAGYNGSTMNQVRYVNNFDKSYDDNYKSLSLTALTLYPATDGKTFGVGTRIRIYGR